MYIPSAAVICGDEKVARGSRRRRVEHIGLTIIKRMVGLNCRHRRTYTQNPFRLRHPFPAAFRAAATLARIGTLHDFLLNGRDWEDDGIGRVLCTVGQRKKIKGRHRWAGDERGKKIQTANTETAAIFPPVPKKRVECVIRSRRTVFWGFVH